MSSGAMPTALDHRGRRRARHRRSPTPWRPPTRCCWRAGRRTGSTPSPTRLGATTWPLDLADPTSIEAAVEPIVELDVLIHNAGVAYPGRVAESTLDAVAGHASRSMSLARWRLRWRCCPRCAAARGHVVFINSGAGINARPAWRRTRRASSRCGRSPTRCAPTSRRCGSPACIPAAIATEMQDDLVAYEGGEYDPREFLSAETVAQRRRRGRRRPAGRAHPRGRRPPPVIRRGYVAERR